MYEGGGQKVADMSATIRVFSIYEIPIPAVYAIPTAVLGYITVTRSPDKQNKIKNEAIKNTFMHAYF